MQASQSHCWATFPGAAGLGVLAAVFALFFSLNDIAGTQRLRAGEIKSARTVGRGSESLARSTYMPTAVPLRVGIRTAGTQRGADGIAAGAQLGDVCGLDPAFCQLPDKLFVIPSDPNLGTVFLDDFTAASDTITEVCVSGSLIDRAMDCGAGRCDCACDGDTQLDDCTPILADQFEISVYEHTAGFPGALMGQSTATATRSIAQTFASFDVWDYSLSLDSPVSGLTVGDAYFLAIVNDTSLPTGNSCFWFAGASNDGNSWSVLEMNDTPNPGDFDMAVCIQSSAPPAAPIGACCNCENGGACLEQTFAACKTDGFVRWDATASCTAGLCPPSPPPGNGCLTDPLVVGDGKTVVDITCATLDGPADQNCVNGLSQASKDFWLDYVATCNGRLTISTCDNAGQDLGVTVWVDNFGPTCACPSEGAVIRGRCRDDSCDLDPEDGAAVVSFFVSRGQCFRIQVWAGDGGADGPISVDINCSPDGSCCRPNGDGTYRCDNIHESACANLGGVHDAGQFCAFDPSLDCRACADSPECDDGRFCNGAEVCTPSGGGTGICTGGDPPCSANEFCDDFAQSCESFGACCIHDFGVGDCFDFSTQSSCDSFPGGSAFVPDEVCGNVGTDGVYDACRQVGKCCTDVCMKVSTSADDCAVTQGDFTAGAVCTGDLANDCPLIGCVRTGDDCYTTPCSSTTLSLGTGDVPSVPADHLYFGSPEVIMDIKLASSDVVPAGSPDTLIARTEPFCPDDNNLPQTQTIAIEIVSLVLRSCQPISIGGDEWTVDVFPGSSPPQPGTMTVTKDSPLGGTFELNAPFSLRLFFKRVSDNLQPPAFAIGPLTLVNKNPVSWIDPDFTPDWGNGDFLPTFAVDPATQEVCVERVCFSSTGGGFTHCVESPDGPPCIEACCLPNGSCQDIATGPCISGLGTPAGVGSMCQGGDSGPACAPPPPPAGACCLEDGGCSTATQAECPGVYQGDDTTCDPTEPCCLPDDTCEMLDPACCVARGGTSLAGESCTTEVACCLQDDTCRFLDPLCCAARGGESVVGVPCSIEAPCCLPKGMCQNLDPACCAQQQGVPLILGSCTAPTACCLPELTCEMLDSACCNLLGGTSRPNENCDVETACCLPDDSCATLNPACCDVLGGTSRPNEDCTVETACCRSDGSCEMLDPLCCEENGGSPVYGEACTQREACCTPFGCLQLDPVCCEVIGGIADGPGLCDPNEACCLTLGACVDEDPFCCRFFGGEAAGGGSFCLGDINPPDGVDDSCPGSPSGEACCLLNGSCVKAIAADCVARGGAPGGGGSACAGDANGIDDACPVDCCLPDGTCTATLTDANCGSAGGDEVPLCLGDLDTNGSDDACEFDEPCEDCGPDPHWIDQCPGGVDRFPSTALVGVNLSGGCAVEINLVLRGPTVVRRSDPLDDSVRFPGSSPIDAHLDVLDTEILSLLLTGPGARLTAGAGLGRSGVLRRSFGVIVEQAADPAFADSFFDVLFEVDLGGGLLAYNHTPLRLVAKFDCVPADVTYLYPTGCIPLFDSPFPGAGTEIARLVSAEHDAFPTEACCFGDESCVDLSRGDCEAQSGVPGGPGTRCFGDGNRDGFDDWCRSPGDANGDGNLDCGDLPDLAACLQNGGPGAAIPQSGVCPVTNANGDDSLDLRDVAKFLVAITDGCGPPP